MIKHQYWPSLARSIDSESLGLITPESFESQPERAALIDQGSTYCNVLKRVTTARTYSTD